jgi:hypothetical protein
MERKSLLHNDLRLSTRIGADHRGEDDVGARASGAPALGLRAVSSECGASRHGSAGPRPTDGPSPLRGRAGWEGICTIIQSEVSVPRLVIPAEHQDGLAVLSALNDIQAQALAALLDADTGHANGKEFAKDHEIPNLDSTRLALVYDMLRELYRVREEEHAQTDEFVPDLIRGMQETRRSDLAVSFDDVPKMKSQLTRLLSTKGFALEAKASGLRRDVERYYCSSRVLTDLRPVFDIDEAVSKGPVRVLVTHTLRLRFHEGYDLKDIYVSLTDANISKLIRNLQRAQEKSKILADRYLKV